ncbi:MAG: hypothetical protein V4597_11450 [Pseudomonadota bacterium]
MDRDQFRARLRACTLHELEAACVRLLTGYCLASGLGKTRLMPYFVACEEECGRRDPNRRSLRLELLEHKGLWWRCREKARPLAGRLRDTEDGTAHLEALLADASVAFRRGPATDPRPADLAALDQAGGE